MKIFELQLAQFQNLAAAPKPSPATALARRRKPRVSWPPSLRFPSSPTSRPAVCPTPQHILYLAAPLRLHLDPQPLSTDRACSIPDCPLRPPSAHPAAHCSHAPLLGPAMPGVLCSQGLCTRSSSWECPSLPSSCNLTALQIKEPPSKAQKSALTTPRPEPHALAPCSMTVSPPHA